MSDNAAMYQTSTALPPTEKQMIYARQLAMKGHVTLPWEAQQDRKSLSTWIDQQKRAVAAQPYSHLPSSRQVAFAERIARLKRTSVPDECFRDRGMLSRWIDSNK